MAAVAAETRNMTDQILADAKAGDVLCLTERLVGPAPDVLRRALVTKTTKTRVHVGRHGHMYTFDRNGDERPRPRYSLGMTACTRCTMTAPIDYSRPVGWWCPVCFGVDRSGEAVPWCRYRRLDVRCMTSLIPVYLPIPEGQRPPAASEVEDAEVVTSYSAPSPSTPWTVVRCGLERSETVLEGMDLAETIQRIVTGATE